MKFFLIVGPPAVGKMAVGKELAKLTSCKLLHNHMSIEFVLSFFEYGTPAFGRLSGGFRTQIMKEVAKSDLEGLIFTYVWDFADEKDQQSVDRYTSIFDEIGADIYYIELEAELEQRLIRNRTPDRIREKPSKQDLEMSEKRLLETEAKYVLNSLIGYKFKHKYLRIDNSDLTPEDVAKLIVDHFKI
jgi:hypothetical protein